MAKPIILWWIPYTNFLANTANRHESVWDLNLIHSLFSIQNFKRLSPSRYKKIVFLFHYFASVLSIKKPVLTFETVSKGKICHIFYTCLACPCYTWKYIEGIFSLKKSITHKIIKLVHCYVHCNTEVKGNKVCIKLCFHKYA